MLVLLVTTAAFIAVAEVTQPRRDLIELGLQALNNLWVGGHGDTDQMSVLGLEAIDGLPG